jgi:hypothetical protein
MAYNNSIPQPGDDPSQSQSLLLQNFQEIKINNDVNHTEIGQANQGKHKFLQMPAQGSSPSTASNEAALFTKQSTFTSTPELVYRRENNGTEIEFTSSGSSTNGWARLPSGILLKWGTATAAGSQSTNFPVSANIPVFTSVFSAQVTTSDSSPVPNTFATLAQISTTAITVFGSQKTSTSPTLTTYRYLVIGI